MEAEQGRVHCGGQHWPCSTREDEEIVLPTNGLKVVHRFMFANYHDCTGVAVAEGETYCCDDDDDDDKEEKKSKTNCWKD